MLLCTPEGPSIDDRDVRHVYREHNGSLVWTTATLCMATGRYLIDAVDALQAKLDDKPLPPIAA
jgi:hypothetical protein